MIKVGSPVLFLTGALVLKPSSSQATPSQVPNAPAVVEPFALPLLLQGVATTGQVLATVRAADPEGGSVTWAVKAASDPQTYYHIDSVTGLVTLTATGALAVNAGLVMPALTVSASDGVNSTDSASTAVLVDHLPLTPTFTPIAALTEETATSGQAVTTYIAVDPDGDSLTYEMVSDIDPGGYYTINSQSGVVTLTAAGANWVNTGHNLPMLQVVATQTSSGGTATSALTSPPATMQVNDAPVVALWAPDTLIENEAVAGTYVTLVQATDEEGDALVLTFAAGIDPNHYFALDAATAEVRLTSAGADYVNAGNDLPDLQVVATDSHGAIGRSQRIAVPSTMQVNDPPMGSVSHLYTPVEDSTSAGFVVAQITGMDEEGNVPFTYDLPIDLNPFDFYAMSLTGQVVLTTTGAAWVNAGNNLPEVGVVAIDSQGASSNALTVPLNATLQMNDAPLVTLSISSGVGQYHVETGTVVATALATDEENDAITYGLGGLNLIENYYQIDALTGEVKLTSEAADWVNAGQNLPVLQVIATDIHQAYGLSPITDMPPTLLLA